MITEEAKLNAANAAIRRVCKTWKYAGFDVGPLVTDDQYDQLSYAVVSALDDLEMAVKKEGKIAVKANQPGLKNAGGI